MMPGVDGPLQGRTGPYATATSHRAASDLISVIVRLFTSSRRGAATLVKMPMALKQTFFVARKVKVRGRHGGIISTW